MLRKLKIPNDPLPCYYSQKFPEAPVPKAAFFLHFLRLCTQLGRFFLLKFSSADPKFSSADPKRNWTLKLMELKKNTMTKKQGHSLLQHPSFLLKLVERVKISIQG